MAGNQGDLLIRIAVAGGDAAARELGKVGKAGRGVGVAVAAGAAVAATGVAKAMRFEEVMAEVKAVTGATERDMGIMSAAALDLGAKTGLGATAAAQAIAALGKAGMDTQTIIGGGLPAAIALAAAGNMELEAAASATANTMGLFGLKASEAGHIADALATAANQTTADVSDFTLALSQGGSAAKAAGLDFDQTTAALMALASIGVKGSDAGTSLKSMLTQLASPTKESAKLMDQLGLKFFDANGKFKNLAAVSTMLRDRMKGMTQEQRLQTATTLAGTDGMRGLLALYDAGPKKLDKYTGALAKEGTAAAVAKTKQDTLAGSMRRLRATIDAVMIRQFLPFLKDAANGLNGFLREAQRGEGVGGALVDVLVAARDAARWLVGTVDDLVTGVRWSIGAFNAALPVIAGVSTALLILNAQLIAARIAWAALTTYWVIATAASGGLTVAMGALNAVMALNPFVLVAAAIAGLVVGLVVLWKKNEGFRNWVTGAWNTIKTAVGGVVDWLRPKIAAVGQVLGAVASAGVAHARRIISMWTSVLGFFRSLPGRIGGFFSGMWDGIKSGFKSALNFIIGILNRFIGTYNGTIGKLGSLPGVPDTTIPEIPMLAQGGIVRGSGDAIVGDAGMERLRKRPDGSVEVTPLENVPGGRGGGGFGQRMVAEVHTKDEVAGLEYLVDLIIDRIEIRTAQA